jgi:hypothetical protein
LDAEPEELEPFVEVRDLGLLHREGQPREAICDRSAGPWDDTARRPSHADRRKALQRQCLSQESTHLAAGQAVTQEFQQFVRHVIKHPA